MTGCRHCVTGTTYAAGLFRFSVGNRTRGFAVVSPTVQIFRTYADENTRQFGLSFTALVLPRLL
jgi:hypothetical protein